MDFSHTYILYIFKGADELYIPKRNFICVIWSVDVTYEVTLPSIHLGLFQHALLKYISVEHLVIMVTFQSLVSSNYYLLRYSLARKNQNCYYHHKSLTNFTRLTIGLLIKLTEISYSAI